MKAMLDNKSGFPKEVHRIFWSAWLVSAMAASTLQAQVGDAPVAVITQAELTRHVRAIADDSMKGRETPSRGLDLTAKYIADQFAAVNLGKAGNRPDWIVPYNIPDRFDFARSRLTITAGSMTATADFQAMAYLGSPEIPSEPVSGPMLLVAGPHTSATLKDARERRAMILYIPPARSTGSAALSWQDALAQIRPGNRGVIAVSNADSAGFAREVEEARRQAVVELGASRGILHIRPEGVAGLPALLAAAGVDLNTLRRTSTPVLREIPSVSMKFEPQLVKVPGAHKTAPNVIGKLTGHDPRLKKEYLLFVARMDHRGSQVGESEHFVHKVDDNAVGVAGLIALAKAFSQPSARPGRTLVFLAVSGGANELWGSRKLAVLFQGITGVAEAPHVSAVINLDFAGPRGGDTLAVTGLDEITWPQDPMWIVAAHPELRLTVVKSGSLFRPTSDHFAFAEAWMPTLSFRRKEQQTGGASVDVLQFDAEQAARIVQLAFHVGLDLSTTVKSPQWTAEIRRRLTRGDR